MSHERDGDYHGFVCDTCDDEDGNIGDFHEVWGDLKQDGWRAFMGDDGEWEHKCPRCCSKGVGSGLCLAKWDRQ